MNYLLFLPLLLVLFACSEEKEKTYAELSKLERHHLRLEIFNSMRHEIYNREIVINRYIPDIEKYDNVIQIEPIPSCGPRRYFVIKTNRLNQIMVRNKLISDANEIAPMIFDYYYHNFEKNDYINNNPLYTRVSKRTSSEVINQIKQDILELEKQDNFPEEIDLKKLQLKEWQDRFDVIGGLKLPNLPEPESRSDITLETLDGQPIDKKILHQVLRGRLYMRDYISRKHFQMPYPELFWNYQKNPSDFNFHMKALSLMAPINVIDKTNIQLYKKVFYYGFEPVPPPEFLPPTVEE